MDAKEVNERLRKAQKLFYERNYEMALVELDELAHIVPDNPEVYYWRGKTLATDLNEENLKGAVEEFSQAINLKPDFAESYFERGKIFIQLGELEKAKEDFKKAAELNPKLTESYVYLAQIELAQGNDQEALKYLEKSSHGKKDYKYYFSLGKIHFNNKRYEQAVEYLSKAIQENPYLVDAYDLRAKSFKELGKYKEAIEDFKRAYTLMPEEKSFFVEISKVHFLLALEEYKKGNIEAAADEIVKGMEINYDIKLDDQFKKILIEAGKRLIETNPKKAIVYFDFALRLVEDEDFMKEETERKEIQKLRKEAIKRLPLKEKLVKIISDIYG